MCDFDHLSNKWVSNKCIQLDFNAIQTIWANQQSSVNVGIYWRLMPFPKLIKSLKKTAAGLVRPDIVNIICVRSCGSMDQDLFFEKWKECHLSLHFKI